MSGWTAEREVICAIRTRNVDFRRRTPACAPTLKTVFCRWYHKCLQVLSSWVTSVLAHPLPPGSLGQTSSVRRELNSQPPPGIMAVSGSGEVSGPEEPSALLFRPESHIIPARAGIVLGKLIVLARTGRVMP